MMVEVAVTLELKMTPSMHVSPLKPGHARMVVPNGKAMAVRALTMPTIRTTVMTQMKTKMILMMAPPKTNAPL